MECLSFQELGGSTSPLKSGCGHVFIASWIPTAKVCFCPECKMEILIEHQYGMMLKPLEKESRNSPKVLISSSAGSLEHARTSQLQAMEKAWKESEADYFSRSCAWPKKSSPNSYFLKTCQPSQAEADFRSLEKLPRWGMIVDGVLYPLQALERVTREIVGSYWPTPKARDGKAAGMQSESKRDNPSLPYRIWVITGRKMNLPWLEWLMGYPEGWTELAPWAMQLFRLRPKKRSKS